MASDFRKVMKKMGVIDCRKYTTDQILDISLSVLGSIYKEIDNGIFANKIGYVVRMTDSDLNGHNGGSSNYVPPHVNIETLDPKGPSFHLLIGDLKETEN